MIEKTIYYHDTDAIGIVYHSSYLKILEEGRTDFFDSKGISVKDLHERGKYFVVTELKMQYKHAARFGDIVVCESLISRRTDARLFFAQRIYHKLNKLLLIEAEMTVVIINKSLQPVMIPESVRLQLRDA